MTITQAIQLTKERIAGAFGVPVHMLMDADRPAMPRIWSLCMTGENYGEVGLAGSAFQHRGEKHERVLVVEVLTAIESTAENVEVPAQWLRNLAQLRPEAYSHHGLMVVTRAFCNTADDYSAGITPVFATPPATTGASTVLTARGAGQYYAKGSAWSDAVADAATPGSNVVGDGVTISNGSTYSMTKRWDGSAWQTMAAILDGSLLVTGLIHGSALKVGAVEIRKPDGTLILGAGGPLAAEVAAQAGQVAVPDEQLEWSHDLQERLIAAAQDCDKHESIRQVMAEAACLLAALTGVRAPTSGERQEGGAA